MFSQTPRLGAKSGEAAGTREEAVVSELVRCESTISQYTGNRGLRRLMYCLQSLMWAITGVKHISARGTGVGRGQEYLFHAGSRVTKDSAVARDTAPSGRI